MISSPKKKSTRTSSAKAGKYLTFALGPEEYGIEILKVREIIGFMRVTAVPRVPPYVEGVVNLRGQVIPVIDLRKKFEMEAAERTSRTCIIVVETQKQESCLSTGLIVDRVLDVLEIAPENIEGPPAMGPSGATELLLGMGKFGNSVKILLDVDRVLGGGRAPTAPESGSSEAAAY